MESRKGVFFMENEEKLRKRNLITYPLGTMGRDAVYALINSYLLTFVLFTHSLTAAQLTAITGIMIGARVFDAFNDPIMGNIIECTRSKYGKFKPWLLAGILSTSVVIYLMFNVQLQGWKFVVFFGVMYFAFSITYTMNDISYWGMVPALSSDADARNQFASRATLFAGIGGTAATILIPLFTTGKNTIGGNAAYAYGRIALVIGILAPLFLCITIFGTKEHRDTAQENKAKEKFSFRKLVHTIFRNDQLIWVAVIFLIQQIGNGLIVGGIGSTYIYSIYGYEGGLYSLFTTVGMSVTAFLMIFYPTISRHIHRKKLMGYMAVIATCGYVMIFASGLMPGKGMGKFVVLMIGYMLCNFGQYCYYLIMMISIMNTVEYNELKFGSRDEGIITSLRPFITKLGGAIIVAVTSAAYILLGVTDYTNQISELEQQCNQNLITEASKLSQIDAVLSHVTNQQAMGLLIFMSIVPGILMLLSYFLYKKHYKLDEEEYDRICKELGKTE